MDDQRLFYVFDLLMDISQSVLTSFFASAAVDRVLRPRDARATGRLLLQMTRNKVAFQVRRQRASSATAG